MNAGALPVELTRQSVRTVSPTLGDESLHQGIIAGLAGLVLLFVYLLFYYRLLGVVAWFGMTIWAILAITLRVDRGRPVRVRTVARGCRGIGISLGVTADSYIVFFERLKDEVRSGKSPRAAVQPAFARAYKTIVAADIVTGLAAAVLYITAVSSVRGFALTLGVATLLDLFVVYFFKRPTVFLIAKNERLVSLRGFGLTSGVAAEAERRGRACEPPARDRHVSRAHDPSCPMGGAPEPLVRDLRRADPAVTRRAAVPAAELLDRLRGRGADRATHPRSRSPPSR